MLHLVFPGVNVSKMRSVASRDDWSSGPLIRPEIEIVEVIQYRVVRTSKYTSSIFLPIP
jgi:hypothetical protein